MLPVDIKYSLLSNRDAGYSLTEAVSEVADNAIQARADYFHINTLSSGKTVTDIFFSDNGIGMAADTTLHAYLIQGRSSSWMADTGIGKYGIGAKAAAFCQCKRITVYSRLKGTDQFYMTYYDLDDVMASDDVLEIPTPVACELPPAIALKTASDANTVVVWSKLDRWPKRSFNAVMGDLKHELGRMFRNFIASGFGIIIGDEKIRHFDPTFQLEGSFNEEILSHYYNGEQAPISRFEPQYFTEEFVLAERDGDKATLTVTLAPEQVTRSAGMGGDKLARSLKLKNNQGKISYMRSGREVDYSLFHMAFDRAVLAEDRFIGIQINFSPKFDEDFKIKTVKRGVEPQGQMRDRIREALKNFVSAANKTLRRRWKGEGASVDFEATEKAVESLEKFLNVADAEMKGAQSAEQAALRASKLLTLAREIGISNEEEFVTSKANRPLIIVETDNIFGDHLLDFEFENNQVVIRINKTHAVYKTVWLPMAKISSMSAAELELLDPAMTAKHSLESLNMMLFSFAKYQQKHQIENFDEVMNGWTSELQSLLKQVEVHKLS